MAEGGKKILVVDDEKLITKVLAHKLEDVGYTTKIVLDGQEAIDALAHDTFDLILLDLVMPHKDGFTVLEELRNKNNTTPIIITSNLSQGEDIVRAKSLGAQYYFVKAETTLQEIVNKIKAIIA